jgi:hypothetical protein
MQGSNLIYIVLPVVIPLVLSGFLSAEIAPAIYGARTGTAVQVWLGRSGEPQLPPAGQREIVVTALIAGFIVTIGGAGLLMLCYRLCRLALDRHRLAGWGSAWAATGPPWTSRQLCWRASAKQDRV